LSLRIKLLLAAAGIVAISLLLSGVVTGVLVRSLELDNAHVEVDRTVNVTRAQVMRLECVNVTPICGRAGIVSATEFEDRINSRLVPDLNGDRLLLLDSSRSIVYDSASSSPAPAVIPLSRPRLLAGQGAVSESNFRLGTTAYLGAAVPLDPRRNPLSASHVLLAREMAPLEARAASDLLPRLLFAGGLALITALTITFLLGRALARPLGELAEAAQDLEAGNYARRVAVRGGDEIGLVGTAFNRMAAAVERARSAQRDFVANVSHELKTPLTSLIGFSQALVDGSIQTTRERDRAAVIINEEAHRVLRMAQELLDLARVEGGQIAMRIEPVDMGALLQQQIEVLKPRAAARKLALALEVPPTLHPVEGDVERLHQILDNLLDNAVKYTPESGVVQIGARQSGGEVEVTVSNPVGPHRPDPQRMFDRFYRADPSRSSSAGGVGLGLAISRELAAVQHGRLWADLDTDGRLTVHLRMPVSHGHAQDVGSAPVPEATSAPMPPLAPAPPATDVG
jgi:signal transduction histidine kinase